MRANCKDRLREIWQLTPLNNNFKGLPSPLVDDTSPITSKSEYIQEDPEKTPGQMAAQLSKKVTEPGASSNSGVPKPPVHINMKMLEIAINEESQNSWVVLSQAHLVDLKEIATAMQRLPTSSELKMYLRGVTITNQLSATHKISNVVENLEKAADRLSNLTSSSNDNTKQILDKVTNLLLKFDLMSSSTISAVKHEIGQISPAPRAYPIDSGSSSGSLYISKGDAIKIANKMNLSPSKSDEFAAKYHMVITSNEFNRIMQGECSKEIIKKLLESWKVRLVV